jgi:hypothetical protein
VVRGNEGDGRGKTEGRYELSGDGFVKEYMPKYFAALGDADVQRLVYIYISFTDQIRTQDSNVKMVESITSSQYALIYGRGWQ